MTNQEFLLVLKSNLDLSEEYLKTFRKGFEENPYLELRNNSINLPLWTAINQLCKLTLLCLEHKPDLDISRVLEEQMTRGIKYYSDPVTTLMLQADTDAAIRLYKIWKGHS